MGGIDWRHLTNYPAVRTTLVVLGFILIALTPLVGPIPGPGGVVVFAAGLHRDLAGRLPTSSTLPMVASSGLLLVAAAQLLGSGLTTEFVFGVQDPEQLVPETAVLFGHWIGTIPWLWGTAGLTAVALGCGDVVAVGPGTGRIRVGDRVVVYHISGCGQCDERVEQRRTALQLGLPHAPHGHVGVLRDREQVETGVLDAFSQLRDVLRADPDHDAVLHRWLLLTRVRGGPLPDSS